MRLIDADALKTWFGEKDLYAYDYIVGTIDDAPTIVEFDGEITKVVVKGEEYCKRTQWIPCSERLPELDDEVLVTDDNGELRHCIFCTLGETWCGFITYEEGMRIIATAWMPLPPVYKGE